MTGVIEHDEASKLAYVVDLATRLADRILDGQVSGRAIEPELLGALVRAAGLMQELGVPWPPLVAQVLHEFADGMEAAKPGVVEGAAPTRLSRFLGSFRREPRSVAEV